MKFKAIVTAIAFILLLGFALADCSLDTNNSDAFLFRLHVKEDSTATMEMDIGIPYSYECLVEKGMANISITPKECDEALINDVVFRAMDFFVISSQCSLGYDSATSHIIIKTSSQLEKIASKTEDDYYEIRFSKWALDPSKPGIKNTLEVFLPEGSEIVSYFPQRNSSKTGSNSIRWSDAPGEPISVKYSLPKARQETPLPLFALIAAVAIAAALAAIWFACKMKQKAGIKKLSGREKTLNKKLEDLRVSYLKRRINEETYKNLVEEISLKITDVRVKKKELIEKSKGKQKPKKKPGAKLEEIKLK